MPLNQISLYGDPSFDECLDPSSNWLAPFVNPKNDPQLNAREQPTMGPPDEQEKFEEDAPFTYHQEPGPFINYILLKALMSRYKNRVSAKGLFRFQQLRLIRSLYHSCQSHLRVVHRKFLDESAYRLILERLEPSRQNQHQENTSDHSLLSRFDKEKHLVKADSKALATLRMGLHVKFLRDKRTQALRLLGNFKQNYLQEDLRALWKLHLSFVNESKGKHGNLLTSTTFHDALIDTSKSESSRSQDVAPQLTGKSLSFCSTLNGSNSSSFSYNVSDLETRLVIEKPIHKQLKRITADKYLARQKRKNMRTDGHQKSNLRHSIE
ncbi:MAG: hypothetical protein M1829_002335 [Trizodia sp. TS-e1964]|nr:MAG: hypothetical protein M1829_002335 [Trizodia sp. TS-e1964]